MPSLAPHEIGARLAAARQAKGISQVGLAEQLDVDQKTISRWELGARTISALQLVALCDAIGVDPGDVLAPVEAA